MKRKLYNRLKEWKDKRNGNTSILIQGARRVGKSYIAEEFAKAEYKSYILIDFNIAPKEVKDLFEYDINDLDIFYLKLCSYYNVKLYERDSLIILDEVQIFPRARSLTKYLVADGRYDIISTGSLISIKKNVEDILIPSEEERINMYPMDFEEFMWALGNEILMELIKDRFLNSAPMGQALHRKAMDYFRQYLVVGGMPQAVDAYIKTGSFDETDQLKRRILNLYRDDIQKHAAPYVLKVENIFDEIPSQLKKQNRHFKLSALSQGARFSEYAEPLLWLSDAMIVDNCYNSTEPSVGLKLNENRTLLKCYMADTGLLISHSFDENGIVSEEIYKKLLFNKLEINLGMIVENAVAQMLTASGHRLFFYTNSDKENKENRMEIDFLLSKSKITNRHNISPIEVKSGKNYTINSLRKFMTKYAEQLYKPYVVHTSDLYIKEDITYLPIYMVPCL